MAYYTGEEIRAEALRTHLSSRLPEYMVPAAYVRLEALPLTPNGKLDRRALPAPDEDSLCQREAMSRRWARSRPGWPEIWAELLKLERVGRHDNFFELGGHSLLAITMIERMRREGLPADVALLFNAPTLRALAERSLREGSGYTRSKRHPTSSRRDAESSLPRC